MRMGCGQKMEASDLIYYREFRTTIFRLRWKYINDIFYGFRR